MKIQDFIANKLAVKYKGQNKLLSVGKAALGTTCPTALPRKATKGWFSDDQNRQSQGWGPTLMVCEAQDQGQSKAEGQSGTWGACML